MLVPDASGAELLPVCEVGWRCIDGLGPRAVIGKRGIDEFVASELPTTSSLVPMDSALELLE
jgi:hypothetical protein